MLQVRRYKVSAPVLAISASTGHKQALFCISTTTVAPQPAITQSLCSRTECLWFKGSARAPLFLAPQDIPHSNCVSTFTLHISRQGYDVACSDGTPSIMHASRRLHIGCEHLRH